MASEALCRLDVRLVQLGLAGSRERAKELLAAGLVTVNGRPVAKPAMQVGEQDAIVCSAPPQRYVGRGGEKLEKVLAAGSVCVAGLCCMDVGASTGGFTDCMLQYGAAHVYAVDVGRDQLHARLRQDPRVTVLEETDVRSDRLRAAVPAGTVAFASVDVSFVSLETVLPAVLPYLQPVATLVCLIKPQFEAGRAAVGKHGVVKEPRAHIRVLQEKLALFAGLSLGIQWLTWSPITGGGTADGNIEYLAVLRRGAPAQPVEPAAVVQAAFAALKTGKGGRSHAGCGDR